MKTLTVTNIRMPEIMFRRNEAGDIVAEAHYYLILDTGEEIGRSPLAIPLTPAQLAITKKFGQDVLAQIKIYEGL